MLGAPDQPWSGAPIALGDPLGMCLAPADKELTEVTIEGLRGDRPLEHADREDTSEGHEADSRVLGMGLAPARLCNRGQAPRT
jgi:hypothetical protein